MSLLWTRTAPVGSVWGVGERSVLLGEDILREIEFNIYFLISTHLKKLYCKLLEVVLCRLQKVNFYLHLELEDMILEIRIHYCKSDDMHK